MSDASIPHCSACGWVEYDCRCESEEEGSRMKFQLKDPYDSPEDFYRRVYDALDAIGVSWERNIFKRGIEIAWLYPDPRSLVPKPGTNVPWINFSSRVFWSCEDLERLLRVAPWFALDVVISRRTADEVEVVCAKLVQIEAAKERVERVDFDQIRSDLTERVNDRRLPPSEAFATNLASLFKKYCDESEDGTIAKDLYLSLVERLETNDDSAQKLRTRIVSAEAAVDELLELLTTEVVESE